MATGPGFYSWNLDDGPGIQHTDGFNLDLDYDHYFEAAMRPSEASATIDAIYTDVVAWVNVGTFDPGWPDDTLFTCNLPGTTDSGGDDVVFLTTDFELELSTPGVTQTGSGTAALTVAAAPGMCGAYQVIAVRKFWHLSHATDGTPYVQVIARTYYSASGSRYRKNSFSWSVDPGPFPPAVVIGFEWQALPSPNCQSLVIALTPQAGGDFDNSSTFPPASTYTTLNGCLFEWMEPSGQFDPKITPPYAALLDTYETPVSVDIFGHSIPGSEPMPHALFIGQDAGHIAQSPTVAAPYISTFRLLNSAGHSALPLMVNGGVDIWVKPFGQYGPYSAEVGGHTQQDTYYSQYIWDADKPQKVHIDACGGIVPPPPPDGTRPSLCAAMMMTEDAGRRPAAILAGSKDQPGPVLLQVSADTGNTWPAAFTVDAEKRFDPSLWYSVHSGAPRAVYADGQGGIFFNKASGSGEDGDWFGPKELAVAGTFPIVAARPDGDLFLLAYADASKALSIAASADGESWSRIAAAAQSVDFSQTGRPGFCWLGMMPLLVYGSGKSLIAVAGIDGGASWTQPITIAHSGPYCAITAAAKEGTAYVGAVSLADADKPAVKFWTSGSLGDAWELSSGAPPMPAATGAALWCMEHTGRLLWGEQAFSPDAENWYPDQAP